MKRLIQVIQKLSFVRDLDSVIDIIRHSARELTGADGAAFVLRDKDQCYYVDEDAIGPLWKGRRFSMHECISGWAILNRQYAAIEDVFNDPRIPVAAYRPTFVKSLVIVPIRKEDPIGAIGIYWAKPHKATRDEIDLLQALADSASISIENVRLYEDLKESLAETQRQLGLRDDFISIAAHELKTPLTPLMVQIHLLQRLLALGKFRGHSEERMLNTFAEIAKRQLVDLQYLINNLLDISRIRLDQLSFHFEDNVDLVQLIRSTLAEFHASKRSLTQVKLHRETIAGRWDRIRVTQVLRNLFSNAMKYGEGKPILIEARSEGQLAELIVQDHGIGIPKKDQVRIFDRFERATSSSHFSGMGLGLYIIKRIIEAHQGIITLDSEPEKGSTFKVELPLFPKEKL